MENMRFALLAWIAVAVCVTGAEMPASAPGSFAVDALTLEWRDTKRQRDVPAKIYFPKSATNACPVIVFSHGVGGSREGYEYLGRHWASHGYVSVHLQHHGSDDAVWRGVANPMQSMRSATMDPLNAVNRAIDVSFALDELTAMNKTNAVFRGKLDLDRIGVAGHSFGAWTTLAVAGQSVGLTGKSYADQRVKAAIAMSAPVPKIPATRNYSKITIPLLHMTGTADNSPIGDTAAKDRRIPFDEITNTPQFLVTFTGGDHMLFSGPSARRAETPQLTAMHETIRASTTAFWDAYLRNDVKAKVWLTDGGFEKALGEQGVCEKKLGRNK